MKPKSLFNIILKVIGIFFIKDAMSVFPQIFSSLFYFTVDVKEFQEIIYLLLPLFSIVLYILIIYYLIFNTNVVIKQLSLDKHFDEQKIELNIHRSTVLSIALLVVGILVLFDSVPILITNIFEYIRQSELSYGAVRYNLSFQPTLVSLAKILAAYILIINQKSIVNWIELKRKKSV